MHSFTVKPFLPRWNAAHAKLTWPSCGRTTLLLRELGLDGGDDTGVVRGGPVLDAATIVPWRLLAPELREEAAGARVPGALRSVGDEIADA